MNVNDYEVGWAGRVMQWLRFMITLVVVNLLFVAGTVAGLVVFGLFPAATASTILLARLRAGAPSDDIVRDFISAYRAQFWHLNVVAIPFWIAAVLIAFDVLAFQALAAVASPVSAVLLVLFVATSTMAVLAAAAAITICARYRDTARATWRYAFVLPLVSPAMSLSLIVGLGAVVIALMAFGVLVPLVGASAPLVIAGWLIDRRLAALDTEHLDRVADSVAPTTPSSRSARRVTSLA